MNAPVLTAKIAAGLIADDDDVAAALQALATDRTRCIQPLSEEEHRAEFNKMYDGFRLLPSSANYRENCFLVWLACARANGLVK